MTLAVGIVLSSPSFPGLMEQKLPSGSISHHILGFHWESFAGGQFSRARMKILHPDFMAKGHHVCKF